MLLNQEGTSSINVTQIHTLVSYVYLVLCTDSTVHKTCLLWPTILDVLIYTMAGCRIQ